jgi:hypothetical protein
VTKLRSSPAYARFDTAHVFDGLFVPTNGKKRARLDVPARKFGQYTISFKGYEQTGADDQSVLLAVTAQLGIDGMSIGEDPQGDISKKLRESMSIKGDSNSSLASMETSIRSILIDAGYKDTESGAAFKRVKESLDRLRMSHIVEVDMTTKWNRDARLLAAHFNEETGKTYLAVNPRLTSAIFSGQHIKISLFERNALESEVAKILHCWLCSHVRLGSSLGKNNGASLDTLAPHVWGPSHEEESKKVKGNRRGRLKEALQEIQQATKYLHKDQGWNIEITASGIAYVTRPKKLPIMEQSGKLPSMLAMIAT